MQPIVLYNLSSSARPNEQWSFNTFKGHYTLVLKNLAFTTKWIEFHEIPEVIPDITITGFRPTLPVITDRNNTVVQDSWDIAKYLETAYPDTPSIFNGAEALHYYFFQYFENNIKLLLLGITILDINEICGHDNNPKGFRQSIESSIGVSLEAFSGKKEDQSKALQEKLTIIRNTLSSYAFLTGDKIGMADIVLVGGFYMVEFMNASDLTTYVFTGQDDVLSKYYYRVMDELKARDQCLATKA
ncbi:hypothetical protein BDF14DRAFT_1841098 [Spinellus fusiger]|nr:hypothetical protein BDF14DRAFT_1745277 [Spinellus fusiger]KAI7863782.1 hypothetical protein BDF14DRAFT_1841098 [Spinellus fusiger]